MLGYSFLEANLDTLKAVPMNNVAPTADTISSLEYPGARQLYVYAKGEHLNVIPGMKEFLAEYARAWGAGSYLAERGLIPSPADVQAQATAAATQLTPMPADALK